MDEITDKEKLLKNIRNALIDKVENPFHDLDLDSSVYPPIEESPDIYFVRRFIEVGGKFVYCANELELSENLSDLLVNENLFPVFTPDERIRYPLLQNGIDVIHNEEDSTRDGKRYYFMRISRGSDRFDSIFIEVEFGAEE